MLFDTCKVIAALIITCNCPIFGQEPDWEGVWVTERGVFELKVSGERVTGKVNKDGTIRGTVKGGQLDYKYTNGRDSASGKVELTDEGLAFEGTYQTKFQSGKFKGWKKQTDPEKQDKDFTGVWLSSLGTLMLQNENGKLSGTIGPEGWSTVKNGKVSGGQLDFDWVIRNFKGNGWFQITSDGSRLFGVMNPDKDPSPWFGIRPGDYTMEAQAIAGEIVKGISPTGMLYNLRMPDDWKPGQPTDVIVLLHGSNWTTSGMVFVTAKNWPEIGKKFAILGIQGQNWAKWSNADDLRFNYTYINWVGRSKLGGYPYTNKESPFLVGQLIDGFKDQYNFDRVFVGGHSQGGYLTYILHMHYPEKIAGSFPIAGGMIIQAEPDVFEDKELMLAQRETPMYILHGKKDGVVSVNMGTYAHNRLRAHGFDRVVLSTPSRGHPYDFLPINKAIQWLDMMSTKDAPALAKFGETQVKLKKWQDVGMVIERAKAIEGGKEFAKIWTAYKQAAQSEAENLLALIEENKNGKWIDRYYEFRTNFALGDDAKEVIAAFDKLQQEHEEPAEQLYKDARKAFQKRDRTAAYEKYEEIVTKYYASTRYLTTKKSLDDR